MGRRRQWRDRAGPEQRGWTQAGRAASFGLGRRTASTASVRAVQSGWPRTGLRPASGCRGFQARTARGRSLASLAAVGGGLRRTSSSAEERAHGGRICGR